MPCRHHLCLGVSPFGARAGRFVVLLSNEHDYFFVLYVVYFAAQAWLAVLALAHYPGEQDLEPLPENISLIVYEVPAPLPATCLAACCLCRQAGMQAPQQNTRFAACCFCHRVGMWAHLPKRLPCCCCSTR